MDLNRRQFLVKTSSSLVAGWALANGLRPSSAAAEEVNSIPFATPVFLMKYPQSVTDFRPVVNKAATTVIFERTIGSSTKLYSLDLTSPSAKPVLFAKGLSAQSFRPDWSWQTGEVVFMNTTNGVYLASASGAYSLITGTVGMSYPTWYPDGATLAVYNNQPKAGEPVPRTSKMDLSGKVLQDVLANNNVWAGFASVNQTSPNLIAFAGQVVIPKGTYNQNMNYIWLTDTSTTPPTVRTLAPGAPTNHFDPNYQGRAPWYSPDGKWIIFESNRFNSKGLYSIFIQIADGSSTAVRVTDPRWDAQHAKFYPSGTELVVTVLQKFGGTKRGIAKLDVSKFVS
jgi:Tol biopolymer transport system component